MLGGMEIGSIGALNLFFLFCARGVEGERDVKIVLCRFAPVYKWNYSRVGD